MAVFETISHGLCHAVNTHQNSLDLVLLDSFDKGSAREPYYAKCGRLNGRLVGLKIDCYPNLVRVLGCQAVESKCRQKANDASRNEFGSHSKTMMFGNRRLGERVNTASWASKEPLAVEAKQRLPGDPTSFDVARTDERLVSCQFETRFMAVLGMLLYFGSLSYLPI